MKIIAQGTLRKMKSRLEQPVSYRVPLGDEEVLLNSLLKKKIRLFLLNYIRPIKYFKVLMMRRILQC